jgi:tRNA-splicing endonuclease subunit Sen34
MLFMISILLCTSTRCNLHKHLLTYTSLRAPLDVDMPSATEPPTVTEPLPIFKLAQRYIIYDADTVAYLRREHNICGVLIGGLAQAPQQNVFSGLPLELLPEEARLLVEKNVAYVIDDVVNHRRAFLQNGLSADERRAYQSALRKQGLAAAGKEARRKDERKKVGLQKANLDTENWNDLPEDMLKPSLNRRETTSSLDDTNAPDHDKDDETLFSPSSSTSVLRKTSTSTQARSAEVEPYAVTPTNSYPPLQSSMSPGESVQASDVPDVPESYPIFRYLHDRGYFLAPGLRFGCQYMAYPGDPLRFHSHFLVNGLDWDQEFDLLDLVAGGRLGTGVKKGYLLGGREARDSRGQAAAESGDETGGGVRSFCVEWSGF